MAMGSWNKLSYHRRLFLWLIGYSLLLVGCFTTFQYFREKEFKIAEINSQLQLINTYILTELDRGTDASAIDLDEFQPFEGIRLSVISDDGEVVYDNTLDSLASRRNHLGREEIREAMLYATGYTVRRHSESTGETYFYSAKRGEHGYIVRTAVPYTLSLNSLLQADYGFLWSMGTIAVVMCVLGYFATRRLGVNIMRLSKFAENVEKGARITDTEPFPHDELGEISSHIVRLYARLQQANADKNAEHRAAQHEQLEKERIKKQLTNNINHELKTPVASIQVCVETLMAHNELDENQRNVFLQRCLANTGRLRRLLDDVALITRMDDGGAAIVKEPVDLQTIIADVVAEREPMARSKGMTIINEVDRPINMQGNISLLESVFNNLIDNAIAYSGGTCVRISANYNDDRGFVLTLADDGSGIPEEHLPRIFERFYRIDKGRSRKAGGTGLGLAIVKNAVAIHGGTIAATNLHDGGLLFTIRFPNTSA